MIKPTALLAFALSTGAMAQDPAPEAMPKDKLVFSCFIVAPAQNDEGAYYMKTFHSAKKEIDRSVVTESNPFAHAHIKLAGEYGGYDFEIKGNATYVDVDQAMGKLKGMPSSLKKIGSVTSTIKVPAMNLVLRDSDGQNEDVLEGKRFGVFASSSTGITIDQNVVNAGCALSRERIED